MLRFLLSSWADSCYIISVLPWISVYGMVMPYFMALVVWWRGSNDILSTFLSVIRMLHLRSDVNHGSRETSHGPENSIRKPQCPFSLCNSPTHITAQELVKFYIKPTENCSVINRKPIYIRNSKQFIHKWLPIHRQTDVHHNKEHRHIPMPKISLVYLHIRKKHVNTFSDARDDFNAVWYLYLTYQFYKQKELSQTKQI